MHYVHRRYIFAATVLSILFPARAVEKPAGCFASAGATSQSVVSHPACRGVLVRTSWESIEPKPDEFDFSGISNQLNLLREAGKGWSLAVAGGGTGSPDWLCDALGAQYIDYEFRGEPGYRLPLFWDAVVQKRLSILADTLGRIFNSDTLLKLVYVTQMTANGIEGHLQGVNMTTLKDAGFTHELWIEASLSASRVFAAAFPDKALAFEVHEIDGSAEICDTILGTLWEDLVLEHRMGAAMWWISGKTPYQTSLIQVLSDFPGDIYGQVIGRSDEPERFADSSYATVFNQAKEIGLRYIEPWNYEFQNRTHDSLFADFNAWADSVFQDGTAIAKHAGVLNPSGNQAGNALATNSTELMRCVFDVSRSVRRTPSVSYSIMGRRSVYHAAGIRITGVR